MGWLVLNCNIINAGIMYQKTNHQCNKNGWVTVSRYRYGVQFA